MVTSTLKNLAAFAARFLECVMTILWILGAVGLTVPKVINPFHATVILSYSLKTLKNQSFSDVFRGNNKRLVVWNRLKISGFSFNNQTLCSKENILESTHTSLIKWWQLPVKYSHCTNNKALINIKDFLSKCGRTCSFLRIWSYLQKNY